MPADQISSGRYPGGLCRNLGKEIAAAALIFSASCALMTFQTPEVIPPGHAAVGAGAALGAGGGIGEVEGESMGAGPVWEVAAWGRFGIARRVDVGLKASSTWGLNDAIFADFKYQSSVGAVQSSIGLGLLGWGYFRGRGAEFHGPLIVPTALTGKNKGYIGLRVPVVLGSEGGFLSIAGFSIPLGLKLGGPKFMTMLEADVHLPYPVLCLGLGFQYAF